MGGEKDEIPDLFPTSGERAPEGRESRRPPPPVRGAPAPANPKTSGAPAPPRPKPVVAAEPAPAVRAPAASAPEEDFGEFDVVGAASRRATELVNGLSLDFAPKKAREIPPSTRGPELDLGIGLGFEEVESTSSKGSGSFALDLAEPLHVERSRSSYPPAPGSLRPSSPPPSVRPPSGSSPSMRASSPPNSPSFGEMPKIPASARVPDFALGAGMGGMAFDLDAELGMDGIGKDLAVAVPLATRPEDDTPWPTGVTPHPDDHEISRERAAEISGFGAKPTTIFGAPLYALRVELALRDLDAQIRTKREALRVAENSRDARLADLARSARPDLGSSDRFAGLFAEADRYDELEEERARALHLASEAGASSLQSIEERAEQARIERELCGKRESEQRAVVLEAERVSERCLAQKRRVEIEKRNVEQLARERVGPGQIMPEDLARRFVPLEEEFRGAIEKLSVAKEQEAELKRTLRVLEGELIEARAKEQRIAGEREAFLLSHEGDVGVYVQALDEAKLGRQTTLANAARAILSLRGEVKVPRDVRRELLTHDDLVKRAAFELELVLRARGSLDAGARSQGRVIGVVVAFSLVLLVLYLALR